MSSRRAIAWPLLGCAAIGLAWTAPSCRGLTVCGESCEAAGGAVGGDVTPPSGGEGGARTPASEGGAGGDSGGQAGSDALAGSPPAMGEAGAPACAFPRAECDGTLQTVCESDLSWNAGRCGSCSRPCDGACEQARCRLKEPIAAGQIAAILTDVASYHYLLNTTGQLLRVDSLWANLQLVASGLDGSPNAMARSGNFIYVWNDSLWITPQRVPLDGGAVVSEDFESTSFGASTAGIYYVSDGELWFRPSDAAEATVIDTRGPEIICSSPQLVLLEEDGILYRASGSELIAIGAAPRPIERAVCSGKGALLLGAYKVTHVTATAVGETVPLPEGRQALEAGLIAFDGSRFSLAFESKGQVNVRTFRIGAAEHESIVGLPSDSILVHRDRYFVWYNAPDPPNLSLQLQRASAGGGEL